LLDLGGFHWGDDIIFDSSSGGIDADAGFKQSTQLLQGVVLTALVEKCGYRLREIVFFGFGQGGMAALNAAGTTYGQHNRSIAKKTSVKLHESAKPESSAELGGVVSIGGPLPAEAPASIDPKCKTPVLVCAGSDASLVTSGSETKLRHCFDHVEIKRYRKPGDSMPSNRDEMMPIVQFFARRLRSTKGVPKGSVDVG